MTATQIILIRHGQTEWNAAGRFQGQLNSNLSAQGRAQASALGSYLSRGALDHIYASDLDRAHQTATILAELHTLQVSTDPRLGERAMGVFEGNTRPDIENQYPQAWRDYKSLDPDYEIEGGGESIHHVESRAFACLHELTERHSGETIGCVSHGGLIRIVLKSILGIPFQTATRFRVQNTSVHHLEYDESGWAVKTLGSVAHLP